MRFYVGLKGGRRFVFKSATVPTRATHGHRYNSVIGPYRTKRAAVWSAVQADNPHFQTAADAERISKQNGIV